MPCVGQSTMQIQSLVAVIQEERRNPAALRRAVTAFRRNSHPRPSIFVCMKSTKLIFAFVFVRLPVTPQSECHLERRRASKQLHGDPQRLANFAFFGHDLDTRCPSWTGRSCN